MANTENSDSLITLMTRSNITIRSNVFVRNDPELRNDPSFTAQVRGRNALSTLLRRLEPNGEAFATARTWLTRSQLAQVAWQSPCSICGAFPEGPVTRDGKLEIQFRCPRKTCTSSEFQPRIVVLSLELVRRCSDVFKKQLSEIIQDALAVEGVAPEDTPSKGPRVPVVVRLTLAQRYFHSDSEIESALRHMLRSREPS